MLASGGDDCSVLIWDLLASGQSSTLLQGGAHGQGQQQQKHVNGTTGHHQGGDAAGGGGGGSSGAGASQGPSARWECEYEVANVSWAPRSGLTGGRGGGDRDWLGVCAGRGVWGVEL